MPPKKAKAKGGGKAKRVTFDKDDDGHEDARGAFMASEFVCCPLPVSPLHLSDTCQN